MARRIASGDGLLAQILGDSMQPEILDNDTAVVSANRRPRSGDVVLVRADRTHPIYGDIAGSVWRYHGSIGRAYLTKDNRRYPDRRIVTAEEILGVVIRVVPREHRDENENWVQVQQTLSLHESVKDQPPEDLGYYLDKKLALFRTVFRIQASELIGGRLPWGLFRSLAIDDHPQVGIEFGDSLTIEPTVESHVGLTVVKRNARGQTILGLLQREGLDSPRPGEFYLDLADRRVLLSQKRGRIPTWHTIAVIRRIERRGAVVALPSVLR
jgi:hypothetical protein